MTDHTVSTISAHPDRQLLAEFVAASEPGSSRQLLEQAMAAIQGLGLQPLQLERIHEALRQALARAVHRDHERAICWSQVRVWVVCTYASCRGWGFFLVEKDTDTHSEDRHAGHLVELFLYQECD